jgi:hypothetical protein
MRWLVTAVLEHDGTRYPITQDWNDDEDFYDTPEEMFDNAYYMWTEGNYSCDCNRLLFIDRRYFDEDASWDTYRCGETITLISLSMENAEKTAGRLLYHHLIEFP